MKIKSIKKKKQNDNADAMSTEKDVDSVDKNGYTHQIKKHNILWYSLPWNLMREIRSYGVPFDKRQMIFTYGGILFLSVLSGYLFKLPFKWYIPLIVFGFIFSSKLLCNHYRNIYEYQRFMDVNTYVEQMLYAFRNSQKILTSLEDVAILYAEDSPMRKTIENACEMIYSPMGTTSEGSVTKRALMSIEKAYPNDYIKSLHEFMLKVERIGGNFDSSIDLLLNNRKLWENRVYALRDKRKIKHSTVLVSCLSTVLISLLMLYLLPKSEGVNLSSSGLVCASNTLLVIVSFAIYVRANSKLAVSLIAPKSMYTEKDIAESYKRYVNYKPAKELRKSLLYSIIPAIVFAWGVLSGNKIMIVIGACLLAITLSQHIIGHKLLEKKLRGEVSRQFPQWLMELALLLQSDNVQVSIFKTIPNAKAIMRPELERFRRSILQHPGSPAPYLSFFDMFQMPEITTSMQMLYSLAVGSGGDSSTQIANIVDRNNLILDRAESKADDDSLASLSALILAPALVGSFALMADMTVYLLQYVGSITY